MIESNSTDFFSEILQEIRNGKIKSKEDLQREKMRLSKKYSLLSIPGDSEILNLGKFNHDEKKLLRIKRTRTVSGVAVVAAMTSPDSCPHGKCIYCPGGIDNNSPQAYTGYEPAALRGRDNNYIPYDEVFNRLKQLETIGHDTSKVDLIIMGGTFTARPDSYQRYFIKGCIDAMNGFESRSLEESILYNEKAKRRCIGLTVETKPDWYMENEIDTSLDYGTTKVELGVQVLSENILRLNNRGHGINEIVKSTRLSRDAGIKIVYHLMPGMYGSSMEEDKRSFDLMIEDQNFRPDMLKIYPTLVVKGTSLYKLWKMGRYVPPDTESIIELLTYYMQKIPPWIRIQRIQRDIPVKFIEAGVKRSDIRNLIEDNLRERNIVSREIRSREIFKIEKDQPILLKRNDYDAGFGKEIFLSYETEDGYIAGFLRLRIPSEYAHRQEITGNSIIREVKVFGEVVPIGEESYEWQHKGIGRKLIGEAESITKDEFGRNGILVISGIGVREYFRKLGYERKGPYMFKGLN
jgi:elongator complex protein 3